MLIMGSNLLKGLRGSGVQKSVLVGIIVVKYIAMPIIGIGVIKGASRFGLVHDDRVYQFVLLLQFAVPPGEPDSIREKRKTSIAILRC